MRPTMRPVKGLELGWPSAGPDEFDRHGVTCRIERCASRASPSILVRITGQRQRLVELPAEWTAS
jgi:hypothetical protein